MASFTLLDPQEEEELAKTRLLNVEEKPFKRIMKRMVALHSLGSSTSHDEGDAAATENGASDIAHSHEATLLLEEANLDFAAFDAQIVRLQFQKKANKRQWEQYESDHVNINGKRQRVIDENAELHTALKTAKVTLEQRKKYDVLADKITINRALKPRDEQIKIKRKLNEEIAQAAQDAEAERESYRRKKAQFMRYKEELGKLDRLFKDEEEERERREGMVDEGPEGGAGDDEDETQTPRPGIASGNATPRPDSGVAARHAMSFEGGATPRSASVFGGRTPARETPGPDSDLLKPVPDAAGSISAAGSRAPSRATTPRQEEPADDDQAEDVKEDAVEMENGVQTAEDTEMVDQASTGKDATPQLVVEGHEIPLNESMETT